MPAVSSCELKYDDSLAKPIDSTQKAEVQSNSSDKLNEAESSNSKKTADITLGKIAGTLGGTEPLIQINGYTFPAREIIRVEIDCNDFYPTINAILKSDNGIFLSRHFPKDGDLLSIFIRSFNDALKPIRNDYLITKVTTTKSGDSEGNNMSITIRGVLNIPLLYAEICKGIKNKTAFDAILEITSDLNVGFASNETKTNDQQNWICSYNTYREFIEQIVSHSWKDDSSYFWAYIDYYYILNYVNLNKLFIVKDTEELKDGIIRNTMVSDMMGKESLSQTTDKNILTNSPEMKSTNYYYSQIQLINKAGEIDILNGYKRYVHFFEKSFEKEYKSNIPEKHTVMYVDPMTTPGSENKKVILKGRANEDWYKKQIKHKWQGLQYSLPDHNVHNYYKFAEIHNFQNLEDLNKLNIRLTLPNPNMNFYKGQRLPLMLLVTRDPERVKVAGNEEDKPRTVGATLDRFMSGNYTIIGIKLIYEKDDNDKVNAGRFSQELLLARREWSMPNSITNLDENDPEKWSTQKPL